MESKERVIIVYGMPLEYKECMIKEMKICNYVFFKGFLPLPNVPLSLNWDESITAQKSLHLDLHWDKEGLLSCDWTKIWIFGELGDSEMDVDSPYEGVEWIKIKYIPKRLWDVKKARRKI